MKKAVLISCFQWYYNRFELIQQYLESNGYEVEVWMSDFLHFKKERVVHIEGCNYIHVYPYKKNMSFARMYSHYDFGQQMYKVLSEKKPDLVVANIPPNIVAKICGKFKRKNPSSKLVFDIMDMWPESYTKTKFLSIPFRFWSYIRDNNLKYADHIFTECELYQSYLDGTPKDRMSVLHLYRGIPEFKECHTWNEKSINIGYLGSINNIIDIDLIENLITELSKNREVNVHIVGGGETTSVFQESLKKAGANVFYHGVIFGKEEMRSIIGNCHFAINMMKPTVCVGLTIKSIDYFQMGVPILNTIKGDTFEIIDHYNCGFNIDDVARNAKAMTSLSGIEYQQMRQNTRIAFNEHFTKEAFMNSLRFGLNKHL